MTLPASTFGRSQPRSEDGAMVTGAARYVDDLPSVDGELHAAFARSPVAHAELTAVDASSALEMPGVVAVFTAADLDLSPDGDEPFLRPHLARDVVRFAGEPFAVVVADTRAHAVDAAERVLPELEPRPPVVDALAALDDSAPRLFDDAQSNVAARDVHGSERVDVAGAGVVVRARFVNQRLAAVPLEPSGALAIPGDERLTVHAPCQAPHPARKSIARALRVDPGEVRVVAPVVGGGFGPRIRLGPEQIVVAAVARRLRRPVRYVESRTENMVAMTHGRAQLQDVTLAATRDGRLTALDVRVVADMGAYPSAGIDLPDNTALMSPGVYRIPQVRVETVVAVTNTTPVAAYRGAGRPEAAALIERAVDMVAAELGMDAVELRRRNLVPPAAFPHTTPTGATYDSGDYERALDEALALARVDAARAEQRARRARGDRVQLGVGVACYVEMTGWGSEYARVEVGDDGRVLVASGLSPTGQGHETALAQLAAGVLGIDASAVTVTHSDTATIPRAEGTMGSRSLQVGGSSVLRASQAVVEKAKRVAARALEVAVDDVVASNGGLGVAGAPRTTMSWAEVARRARDDGDDLAAIDDFEIDGSTYPFGVHVSIVEVDTETGLVTPLRHVSVDDCGRILNPMLVRGQVHGGVAQGIAQARFEEFVYDGDGNPLTSSLATYGVPTARDLPPLESANTETPSPLNPLGAKGVGESGTIGATPAVWNAVVDALSHLGVRNVDMPLTPERVWRALRDARAGVSP